MAQEILILGEPNEDHYDVLFFHQITPVSFDGVVRVQNPSSELSVLATEILSQAQIDAIDAGAVLWEQQLMSVRGGTPIPEAVERLKFKWRRWSARVESDWTDQWKRTGTWVNVDGG